MGVGIIWGIPARPQGLNAMLQWGGVRIRRSRLCVDMEPRPATILIVEDHRATRTFLADNLAADGYELLEADTRARRPRA